MVVMTSIRKQHEHLPHAVPDFPAYPASRSIRAELFMLSAAQRPQAISSPCSGSVEHRRLSCVQRRRSNSLHTTVREAPFVIGCSVWSDCEHLLPVWK